MPDPMYTAGLLFFLPMAVQGGLAVLATLVIFPRSIGNVFRAKFAQVIDPLLQGMSSTEQLFTEARTKALPDVIDDNYDLAGRLESWADESQKTRLLFQSSLSGVAPLRALKKYLVVDFSYSRLSGHDLREIFDQLVLLQIRSAGLGLFYDIISSNARHTHLDSSAFNAHSASHPPSRAASVVELSDLRADQRGRESSEVSQPSTPDPLTGGDDDSAHHRHFPFFTNKRTTSSIRNGHSKPSHSSLLDQLRKAQQPVGVYESQRYMDIEKVFTV